MISRGKNLFTKSKGAMNETIYAARAVGTRSPRPIPQCLIGSYCFFCKTDDLPTSISPIEQNHESWISRNESAGVLSSDDELKGLLRISVATPRKKK